MHGYKGLNDKYAHGIVKHALNEYVKDSFHTNTIEGFWSLFKRGVVGIYHSVSKEHLQNYLNEFSFRYNTRNSGTCQRFNVILGNSEGRLKYKDLIAHAN